MHQVLRDLILVFGASAFVVLIFSRLRQPPIAGYLISGVLLGKFGFGAITDLTVINSLAEIGLVFLLFSIGIEFSLKKLMALRRAFFVAGGLQVGLTTVLIVILSVHHFQSWAKAMLVGVLVSLSSTAICLKLLHSKHELNTPHGNLTMAVLLFQDLMAIPLLVLLPILGRPDGTIQALTTEGMVSVILSTGGYLIAVYLGARYVVPALLDFVAKSRIRELFLIVIAFLTFGTSWVGAELGLSLAMGAFLAGLMVSESRYGNQILSEVAPLKDPFVAVFFVSVGLLLDGRYLVDHLGDVLLAAFAFFVLKFLIAAIVGKLAGYQARVAALFGIYTSQVGEFSFILAAAAVQAKLLEHNEFQFFLSVTVVMMLISPSLIRMAPRLAPHLANLDFVKFQLVKEVPVSASGEGLDLMDHVIIVGFGLNGVNLAKNLSAGGIPYSVIESNIDTVKQHASDGQPILFGDASRAEVLEAAGIRTARMVVVAINDVNWVSKVVAAIRSVRPEVNLIVRCQYYRDAEDLKDYKIDRLVVGEELSSKAILDQVLSTFG